MIKVQVPEAVDLKVQLMGSSNSPQLI